MVSSESARAFAEAVKYIPGGVNSPVRAFGAVGGTPRFIRSASGSRITDVDGNTYVDYVCSWGPLILGHAHPDVVSAVEAALHNGSSFGAPTVLEVELAKLVVELVPSIEKVRMVNSGTEATMSAIRLARGATGREAIVKFEGCYHGHADGLLAQAGSGAMTFGTPTSPGVPEAFAAKTIVLPFNDLAAVRELCDRQGEDIACIIVEPVAGNMGVIPPAEGFLEGLREVTAAHGILLIFDEIITGFRVARGGAQQLYGVTPDLTTLGKIIGGGLPVGAYGGKAEIMEQMSPTGPVYQAGTLSGNPLAMAAGIATLRKLAEPGVYERLDEKAERLAAGLEDAARRAGVKTFHTRVGSMLCTFFGAEQVTDYASAKTADTDTYGKYFHGMLERGFYFAPSQFEAAFVSTAHTEEDLEATIQASFDVLKAL